MKCVSCNTDNLEEAKFCVNCGKELTKEKKLEFYENENMEKQKVENEPKGNKKRKKGLIIGILVALIVLIILGGVFAFISSKFSPENIFKVTINKSYESSLKELKNDYDSIYLSLELSPMVKGSGSKEFEDILNNFNIKLAGGFDYKNKTLLYNLVTNYKDKEFIDADFQYDKEFYLKLNNLYDRPIMAEESDFSDAFNKTDIESAKTVLGSFVNVFNDSLKKSYFKGDKETITVDNKKVKVRTSTLILNEDNIKEIDKYMTKRLIKDDDFISAYAKLTGESKEDVKAYLKEDGGYDDFSTVKVKLYTGMWNKELIKIKIISDDVTVEIEESKKNKDSYVISVESEGITLAFDVKYNYEYNKKIDLNEIKSPIKSEELPSEILSQILTNIKNQEGYKLLDQDVKKATTMSIEELISTFFMNTSNDSDIYSY